MLVLPKLDCLPVYDDQCQTHVNIAMSYPVLLIRSVGLQPLMLFAKLLREERLV